MNIKTTKRKNNSGRPKIYIGNKLFPIKSSLELHKIEALKKSQNKKENEKDLRDYLNFCANFAYTQGSYEKAKEMIYAITADTNKQ